MDSLSGFSNTALEMAGSRSCKLISSRSLRARHRANVTLLICSPPALLHKKESLIHCAARKMVSQVAPDTHQPAECKPAAPSCLAQNNSCRGSQITCRGGFFTLSRSVCSQ